MNSLNVLFTSFCFVPFNIEGESAGGPSVPLSLQCERPAHAAEKQLHKSTIFLHFDGRPSQGEIVSDGRMWHASTPPTLSLFLPSPPSHSHRCRPRTWRSWCSISSLLKCGAGRRREVAAVPGVLGEIGLPSPIIVNIIPADRQAGRSRGRGAGGAGLLATERSSKTHPLRPKLFLIYMFRPFKTVTSTADPPSSQPPPDPLRNPPLHLPPPFNIYTHTPLLVCNKKNTKISLSFPPLSSFSHSPFLRKRTKNPSSWIWKAKQNKRRKRPSCVFLWRVRVSQWHVSAPTSLQRMRILTTSPSSAIICHASN